MASDKKEKLSNLKEVKGEVARIVEAIKAGDPRIDAESTGPVVHLKELLERTEKQAVIHALEHADNNRVEAAKLLGIHRSGLYQKMKKHGIS